MRPNEKYVPQKHYLGLKYAPSTYTFGPILLDTVAYISFIDQELSQKLRCYVIHLRMTINLGKMSR